MSDEPFMNLIKEGKRKYFTAPSGGVTAGDYFLVEGALVCALATADAGDEVICGVVGVGARCPAHDGTAFDDFAVLYWNDTDSKLYDADDGGTGTGHPAVGRAFGAKALAADECEILLDPFA